MRVQFSILSCLLSLASAAIIPGLDGIAGLGSIVPAPAPAPVAAPGTAPLPASNLTPPDPATRPDLPDPDTPPPVLNRPDLPPGSARPNTAPPLNVPPGAALSKPFKLYLIPSHLNPFEYTLKTSFYGPYDVPAFLDADGVLAPSASIAGTFAIVQPQGYLLSLSPDPPTYQHISAPPSQTS
ncbi:hypothetical protein DL98DRAFT_655790 [Cadophora sp. DSE1049]|nr:hypothetical protein DL98DRAFT_655790 [Cadophora sp. DSE1049]